MDDYQYYWDGYGLEIFIVENDVKMSVYLQGDEASQVYDEIESIEDDEILQSYLSQYSEVMEESK